MSYVKTTIIDKYENILVDKIVNAMRAYKAYVDDGFEQGWETARSDIFLLLDCLVDYRDNIEVREDENE